MPKRTLCLLPRFRMFRFTSLFASSPEEVSEVKSQAVKESAKEGLGDILFDPGEKGKVDIVFVHGLGGDRIDTWTWKNEYRTQFWPQTLLPNDCPTARILSFGYNADFAHFYPNQTAPELTIDNYSTSLFEALAGLREKTQTAERPIIFVAHSLGGLVVANALSQHTTRGIADHTVGIVFLGTPFKGSSIATYGRLWVEFLSYLTETQKGNLQLLETRSEKLTNVTHSFAKFLKSRDRSQTLPYLEVACFFEDRPLYKGSIKVGFIVPKDSASWLGVDPISIPKDHIDMCKFQDEDGSDYKSVAGKLRQMVADGQKPRKPHKGGLLGANPQSIGVYQGNVDNRGVTNHGGIVAGNLNTDAQHGITLTGTSNVNHYGAGTKPS
ncbi:Alpha/Beta hydrolase protein [Xylaria telfairii]|nr:Alpha/Beta hydrolase protein [Xylaria telfairii]